ncbi:Protein of unknown function [Pseudomonas citronellolis]|uniref:DUF1302 domain-containing protein n=1 Tax=Pseudomonas citronellolis TaxID=53408 RepID=A0AAQ1HKJ3_9PSED|nr:DUF1302 domain-containing protein [Pseudomonas citronellolis]MDN6874828.1 DUF1302 domain-containing protein [Pseudomonas citronellolis]TGC27775.1 DUF1302 domain-containing protein [Pseudomonas citronellolis]SFC37843.1 Protein of unknown function [Pseudomonas citronellolis]
MHDTNHPARPLRRCLLATAVLAAIAGPQAQAFELDTGNPDLSIRFDNTVKLSYGQRVEGQNGKIANTANVNDGDRNFGVGSAVTQRIDLLSELDFVYRDSMGFRLSGAGWYDHAYDHVGGSNPFPGQRANAGHLVNGGGRVLAPAGAQPATSGLDGFADRYYNGPSGELLDAFVFASHEVGDGMQLSGKLGRHTLYWGETLFSAANGINYGQSALDLGKLYNVPGTEAKELFMPRNQLSMSLTVNPELTLAAQYFLEFENSRFPEGGTYMGPYDMLNDGGKVFWLPIPASAAYYGAPRGHDATPSNTGDFGLMAKWSPEWLDGTLGFYYRKTSDTLPAVLVEAPNLQRPGLAGLPGMSYFTAYADDIDIYGISLSKNVGPVSVGLDVNYRENMPLASNFTTINPTLYAAAQRGLINGANLIGERPSDGDTGLARGKTFHVVLNGLVTFGATPLWDASSLALEGTLTHLVKVTEGEQTFKGDSSYRGVDKVTPNAYAMSASFTPTWYQAFPGVDLSMPMAYNVGLHGNSAVQLGGNEDAGSYSVGVAADFHQKYRFDLKYVDAFGPFDTCQSGRDNNTPGANGLYQCIPGQITSQAGLAPLLKDRGMVTASFKATF